MADRMTHYLSLLGVQPGATLDEINASYYCLLEQFPDNITEVEDARLAELQHAYSIVRRYYVEDEVRPKRKKKRSSDTTLSSVAVGGTLAVIMAVVLVILNFSTLRLAVVRYEPGDIVRWENETTPYGQILRYESDHQFHTGKPARAYEIRLAGTGETVWLSHRVVVKGMTEMDPQEAKAAGFSGS
jgi:hypothetical protein